MHWFWLGFFALVALLLFLDLGVVHRRAKEMSLRAAAGWTAGWVALGLAFTGVVYVMYEYRLAGVHLHSRWQAGGTDAAVTYVSAYLLEQALSVDNIFVMWLVFRSFKMPGKYQHRVLFWGIIGAIGFRVAMLAGGAWLVLKFDWVFYIFGGYLAWQGIEMLRPGGDDDDDDPASKNAVVRFVRRFVRVVDGDHGGKFSVRVDGRRALTTVALCLIVIELTDVVFAMDSIPAVLSISQDPFIMITSNIFAIMGLRSLYFVLAGAMDKFKYLKLAIGVLIVGIGVKMIVHPLGYRVPHVYSLAAIAGILAIGVIASMIASRRATKSAGDHAG